MKRNVFLIVMLLIGSAMSVNAQVTIGKNANPHPSALLDLVSNNKGLLLPRVALAADPTEFVLNQEEAGDEALAVGMIVYNTADDMQSGKGIYFWDGVKWSPVCGAKKKETKLTFSLSRAVTDPRPAYDAYKEAPVTFNGKYLFDQILVNNLSSSNIVEARWMAGTKTLQDFRYEFDKVAIAVAKDPEHYPIYLGLKGSFTNFNEIMNYEGNLEERVFYPFDNNGREIVLPDYGTLTLLFLDMDAVAGGTSEEDAIIFYTFTINTSTNSSAGTALFDYTDYGSGKTTVLGNYFKGNTFNIADGIAIPNHEAYSVYVDEYYPMYLNGIYTVYLRDDKGREGIQTITLDNIRDGSDADHAILWIDYDTADNLQAAGFSSDIQKYTLAEKYSGHYFYVTYPYIELYEDIDATNKPVNSYHSGLMMSFDGKGHTVYGLTNALFGYISGGANMLVIKNVNIADIAVPENMQRAGLISTLNRDAQISNCSVTGEIKGYIHATAGLIGSVEGFNVTIDNCYVNIDLYAYDPYYMGGFVGKAENTNITIRNSYSTGNIYVYHDYDLYQFMVGGILGNSDNNSQVTIENCYSTMNAYSSCRLSYGSIIGCADNKNHTIRNNYSLNAIVEARGGNGSIAAITNGVAIIENNYAWDGTVINNLGANRVDGTLITSTDATDREINHYEINSDWDFNEHWTWSAIDGVDLPILRAIPEKIQVPHLGIVPDGTFNLMETTQGKIELNAQDGGGIVEARYMDGLHTMDDFRDKFTYAEIVYNLDPINYPIVAAYKGSFSSIEEINALNAGTLASITVKHVFEDKVYFYEPGYSPVYTFFVRDKALAASLGNDEDPSVFKSVSFSFCRNNFTYTPIDDISHYGRLFGVNCYPQDKYLYGVSSGEAFDASEGFDVYENGTYTVWVRFANDSEYIQTIEIDDIP